VESAHLLDREGDGANMKMELTELGCEDRAEIEVAQNRDKLRALTLNSSANTSGSAGAVYESFSLYLENTRHCLCV
jgi:hypothetical protein